MHTASSWDTVSDTSWDIFASKQGRGPRADALPHASMGRTHCGYNGSITATRKGECHGRRGAARRVDLFVTEHPDATRGSIIDDAPHLRVAQEPARAIAEQHDGDNGVPADEWASWRGIRDEAAKAMLSKPR